MPGFLKSAILWLTLAGLYFIAAKLGLSLAFEQANTSPVWPPTGIAIAAMVYFGLRASPGILLGAYIVNTMTGLPALLALSIAVGNTFEAIVVFYLLSRFVVMYPFSRVIHVTKFVVIVLLATLVSATVGVTSLALGGIIDWNVYGVLWSTWWLGDIVGGLIIAPLLLCWAKSDENEFSINQLIEALLITGVTFFCIELVFSNWFSIGEDNYPIAFIYLPISMWVAYRYMQKGATLYLITVSILAIYGTSQGYGPFVSESVNESLLLLQGFMGVMVIATLVLAASVDESKKANEKLIDSQSKLKSIVDAQTSYLKVAENELVLAENVFNKSVQAIFITDNNGIILRANSAFNKITGYSNAEIIGRDPRFLRSGKHDKAFFDELWHELLNEGSWQGEVWDRRKNGEIFPTWQTMTAVRDDQNQLIQFISIFSDISEKKLSEERIHHLAHYDIVTGLKNRAAFHDQLAKSISHADRQGHKLALLYLDLDNFKLINDASGHPVGDMLLKHIATRIKSMIRQEDTVARLGGDEFVILLVDINTIQDVAMVAEKVLLEMAKPVLLEHTEVVVTGSVGVSTFPMDARDADILLKNADVAMYRAKEKGRNNFQFYTAEMNAQAEERLQLESDMRKALVKNEFVLHFQPQVNLETGRIIGCEALVRWQHPERGLIPPNIFIPVAEESGLIRQLGEWVLYTACMQQKKWHQSELYSIRMAVNISGRQFISQQLIFEIQKIVTDTGIDPNKLELELTESTIMENVEENITVLQKLHDMGVQLSIDDFGTGYSSMAYLKRFPIDQLKIDQSFVRDIVTDADDAAIVNATTALGHNLNMHVIAEGVETLEQLQFLKNNGCDEIQGYYFSRPVTADEFTALLRKEFNLHDIAN